MSIQRQTSNALGLNLDWSNTPLQALPWSFLRVYFLTHTWQLVLGMDGAPEDLRFGTPTLKKTSIMVFLQAVLVHRLIIPFWDSKQREMIYYLTKISMTGSLRRPPTDTRLHLATLYSTEIPESLQLQLSTPGYCHQPMTPLQFQTWPETSANHQQSSDR